MKTVAQRASDTPKEEFEKVAERVEKVFEKFRGSYAVLENGSACEFVCAFAYGDQKAIGLNFGRGFSFPVPELPWEKGYPWETNLGVGER